MKYVLIAAGVIVAVIFVFGLAAFRLAGIISEAERNEYKKEAGKDA